jgi:hypothetical protein
VDTRPFPGAGVVQLGLGVAWTLFLADPVELGLALLLALDDVVGVTDGEPPGLALGVSLWLGLTLALPDALELALAVPLPLEDEAGDVVVAVVRLGELLVAGVTDECADGDGQALREGCRTTAGLLDGTLPAAGDVEGIVLPWPSGVGVPLEELPVMADQPASVTCRNPWRAGGTTDRTTPTANTAAPTAKAGLSMASRQSLGRCGGRRWGACRRGPCRSGTRKPRRLISPAATPATPSQTPRIHRGWLACAGRDRILSRIRSRPSEPGST